MLLVLVVNLNRRSTRKERHDNLGKIVHWKLARKCNFEAGDKWYEQEPESVLENEDYILWDFSIQTDHVIKDRRPDLVVVDKKERSCKIIDFAIPGDSRIEETEKDKTENIKTWEGSYRRHGMLK